MSIVVVEKLVAIIQLMKTLHALGVGILGLFLEKSQKCTSVQIDN